MAALTVKAPAKVNLGLRIIGRRPDGYHNIHTIFQAVSLFDILELIPTASGFSMEADVDWVPTDFSNICSKVYSALKEKIPALLGVQVNLTKKIPAGGGLGGGSSNGAALAKGLNRMYNLRLSVPDLQTITAPVGADIPFFITGGTQLGDGIGDVLTPLRWTGQAWFLLVVPAIRINTGWAYGESKKVLNGEREAVNFSGFFQGVNSPWELFENDFERIVIPAYPEIGTLKQRLRKAGALHSGLSGSGSTVFGIFDDETTANAAESQFKNSCQTFLTSPITPQFLK